MSKKYNNITNPFINYYLDGGFTWDKNQTFGQNLKNNFQSGALAGATSVTGQLMGQGLSGGLSTGIGNTMQGLGSMASAIPGPWGAVTSAGLNVVGGLVNRLFGSQINQQAVNEFRNQNNQLQNTVLNADNNQDLLSQYGDVNLLSAIDKNSVGKDGLFSNKVDNLTASLNRDRNYARNTYFRGVNNTINNMQQDELFGTTRLAEGGDLFTNGITTINNGGTHEQNPLGGVPMGVDEQGVPNVVEQGELIANDYVYSNRLKVPNKDKVILGLKDKDITYAKALEKLSKESKERPNDPISQRGLQDVLDKLRMSQEELKYKKALKRNNLSTSNVFDKGGVKHRGKRFVIATNNYRFPLEEQYIKKGYHYSMNTMYDGTLLPSINTPKGNVSYRDWDSFKADSMAVAHGVQDAGLFYKGLEQQRKIEQLQKNLTNPVFKKTEYFQPRTLGAATVVVNKKPSKKPKTVSTPTTRVTTRVTPTTRKQQQLISTAIPDFPFNNIQGINIQQPQDLNASFLYPEYSNPNIKINNINTIENPPLEVVPTDIANIKVQSPMIPNIEDNYTEENPQQVISKQQNLTNPFYNPWTDVNNNYPEWNPLSIIDTVNNNDNTTNTKNITGTTDKGTGSSKSLDLTKLRYAPVLGAAIGLSNSLFSKPDYSGVNRLTEASYNRGQYTPVSYNPIGDYMQYQPFDRNYYTNILNANTAATRRAINNQSVGNRATAMAGLLANDYNAQNKLGDLFRQADEYNIAQRQRVADFNRQTNMYNSEMGLKAAMANQSALMNLRNAEYQGLANALQMKDAIDARRGQSMSANLSNLFTSLGNIGIDAYNRNDRDMLINTDTYGTLSQKPQEWSETDWADYKKRHNNTNSNKYGGKLKKRGGFTY